jgi:hypothetical protein
LIFDYIEMSYQKLTFFLTIVLICALAPLIAITQLRVVCIGNSITQGKAGIKGDSSFEFSYRPWLCEKLLKAGFKVNMVGFNPYFFGESKDNLTMKFDINGVPFDRDCEAYYGITSTDFLNGNSYAGWTGAALPSFVDRINDPQQGYIPDIALIHIGTNDRDSTEAQVLATRANIVEIIRVLRSKNPDVKIFVAKLVTGWKKINTHIDPLCRESSTDQSPW